VDGVVRIRYDAGSEFAPDHPSGRILLVLERSGKARLGNWRLGAARAWTGRVDPSAFDAVIAHLLTGGFPDYSPPPIPPSAHFTLTVVTESAQEHSVTDSIYTKNQGLRNAPAWLHAVVRQLSGDAIPLGPLRNQRLVLESREGSIEEAG
jgi:hypothetical protein